LPFGTVIAEHQQHPALNIAMVNQVEDQRDEKDQSFADQGRQHGQDDSYNISRALEKTCGARLRRRGVACPALASPNLGGAGKPSSSSPTAA